MPLVQPLPIDHDATVAELAQFFNTTLGFAPHSVLTMMRRPALARAFTELNRAVMADNTADNTADRMPDGMADKMVGGKGVAVFGFDPGWVRTDLAPDGKEEPGPVAERLVGHIASHVAGCRYCEAHTIRAAARFGNQEGAAPERLDEVWDFRSSARFTAAERAALEYAAAAASVPGAVTPEIGLELRKHWDDGEIVEITGVIALFGFLNRWNDAMATEQDQRRATEAQAHGVRRRSDAAEL